MTDPNTCEIKLTQRKDLILELIDVSKDNFFNIMVNVFNEAKLNNKYHEFLLRDFQEELEKIPQWTREDIQNHNDSFKPVNKEVECFLSNIHILNKQLYPSEIINEDKNDLSLIENFIKNVCIRLGRYIWKQPYLIYDIICRKMYIHKKEVYEIIEKSIESTIRRQSNLSALCIAIEDQTLNKKDDKQKEQKEQKGGGDDDNTETLNEEVPIQQTQESNKIDEVPIQQTQESNKINQVPIQQTQESNKIDEVPIHEYDDIALQSPQSSEMSYGNNNLISPISSPSQVASPASSLALSPAPSFNQEGQGHRTLSSSSLPPSHSHSSSSSSTSSARSVSSKPSKSSSSSSSSASGSSTSRSTITSSSSSSSNSSRYSTTSSQSSYSINKNKEKSPTIKKHGHDKEKKHTKKEKSKDHKSKKDKKHIKKKVKKIYSQFFPYVRNK